MKFYIFEVLTTTRGRSSKSFTLCIYMKTIRTKQAKVQFAYFVQRDQHELELCVKLSLLRLFHVDHFVQKRRGALSLAWYEWFSCKGKEWKIYRCELALSSEPQIWKFHVFFWQTTSKNSTTRRAARAARLFFFIQPIKSLICGVVVDVAVVKSSSQVTYPLHSAIHTLKNYSTVRVSSD